VYRLVLSGLTTLAILAPSLGAQSPVSQGSIDVGTALLRQAGIGEASVLTAAGQFAYRTLRSELAASGIAARTPNDLYTGQGVVTVARYAAPFQPMRWELAATASSYGVSGAAPSTGWQLLARAHVGSSLGGGFAGVAAGSVGQAGVWRRILGAHAGGFARFGSAGADELSAAFAYTDVSRSVGGVPLRYADLFGYWQHRSGPLEILLGGGARASAFGPLGTSGWGSASATVWVMPRVALVVAAGRALEDAARAVPSVRYVSLALRVGLPSHSSAATMSVGGAGSEQDDGRLEVHATTDSMRLVSIRLDDADSVELMADFTDWQPVGMTKTPNGAWRVERPIPPGVHRVAIRVGGGGWFVPSNLAHVADDFGGEVGLLVVP
jgi:hypothetical protein